MKNKKENKNKMDMKDMKKRNAYLYFLAAACFMIASFIGFMNGKSYSSLYLCLGSMTLILGSKYYMDFKKEKEDEDKKNGDRM